MEGRSAGVGTLFSGRKRRPQMGRLVSNCPQLFLFLRAVAGLDAAADVLKHPLGAFGERSGRLQLKIFIQSFRRSRRRNDLAAFVGSCLVNQVYALLVIGVGLGGVGGDGFIEGSVSLVHFAAVGQHRALVVVVLRGPGGIQLRSLIVGFNSFIQLA